MWRYAIKSKEDIKAKGLLCGYYIITDNNQTLYSNKSVQELMQEGYEIIDENTFSELLKVYETGICNKWYEISESDYNYALNVLPPVRYSSGGFYISEATTGNIHYFYQEWNGKFYTSLQDLFTPREQVLKNLKSAIENETVKR